ncbi:MAG TPA: hypothetical protein PLB92_00035 [Rhodoglobus sp.]|nr:hypothetical protein [Rhodoglobus sp.]
MTQPNENQGGNENQGTTSTSQGSETKTFTQDDINKIVSERLEREREKYKDYGDLKKKAEAHDQLVASQQTEQEKILARAEAAEKRAADLEKAEQDRLERAELAQKIEDWKTKIAAESKFEGVPASALRGSTEEELREHAAQLKALIPPPTDPRRGAYVPSEGVHKGGAGSQDPRELFAQIIKNV